MAARRTIVASLVIVVVVFGLLLLGFFLGRHVYWRNSGGDSRPPHKGRVAADVTVAADGSGDFLNVSAALVAAPWESSKRPFRIHVKAGVFHENVVVDKADVHLIGDGRDRSVIRSLKNASAALVVEANGFVCLDLSIENAAEGAGFAAFVRASYVAFFRVSFSSYERTIGAYGGNQFYRECDINGSHNLVLGDAPAFFQTCTLHARGLVKVPRQVVFASHFRLSIGSGTGFVFQFCKFTAASDHKGEAEVYLGKAETAFSRVVLLESYIADSVAPAGWLAIDESMSKTVYFAEYRSVGPGADGRPNRHWPGLRILDGNPEAARKFSASNFIYANHWLPRIPIPFF